MGAEVTVVYRRERKDMPAIVEETEAAEAEGANFVFLAAPHRIVGFHGVVKAIEVVRTKLGEFDSSGRRKPVPTDEIQVLKCDTVILAVGESVDMDFAKASGLTLKESGTVEVDRFSLETSRTKFYAGGDVITGASNVSNAMGLGKKAARNIDQRLMGEKRIGQLMRKYEYDQTPPAHSSDALRQIPGDVPAGERVKKFDEVSLGLTAAEALEEANRCLRCDIRAIAR
jgi:NADH-quinone oxidoreductase subunit F